MKDRSLHNCDRLNVDSSNSSDRLICEDPNCSNRLICDDPDCSDRLICEDLNDRDPLICEDPNGRYTFTNESLHGRDALVSSGTTEPNARIRIAALAFYSVSIFFVDTWVGMMLFFLLAILASLLLKPEPSKLLKLGIPIYIIAAFTILFNSFLIGDNGLSFFYEGFLRGLLFATRIILLVLFSLVVCLTTGASAISSAFSSYLSIFAKFKVPVEDISTILSISLRFIPLTAKEYFSIRDAQWSRGAEFDEGSPLRIVKAHCSILVPLFINMFRRADSLALAMDSRGYGITGITRTKIDSQESNPASIIAGILFCVTCITIAVFA